MKLPASLTHLSLTDPAPVPSLRSVATPYYPPAQLSTPKPSSQQVLEANPTFGYQFYFATPEAADELNETAAAFLQPAVSQLFRRKWRTGALKPDESKIGWTDKWGEDGVLRKRVSGWIEEKRAGKSEIVEGDKVSLERWRVCTRRRVC